MSYPEPPTPTLHKPTHPPTCVLAHMHTYTHSGLQSPTLTHCHSKHELLLTWLCHPPTHSPQDFELFSQEYLGMFQDVHLTKSGATKMGIAMARAYNSSGLYGRTDWKQPWALSSSGRPAAKVPPAKPYPPGTQARKSSPPSPGSRSNKSPQRSPSPSSSAAKRRPSPSPSRSPVAARRPPPSRRTG